MQAERTAAVVYLFAPNPTNLAAYQAAISATDKATPAFTAAMTSARRPRQRVTRRGQGNRDDPRRPEAAPEPCARRSRRGPSPRCDALGFYSQGPADTIKLFLIQTKSVDHPTDQLTPAVGLIATVQAREQLSQENALLAGHAGRARG